MINDVIINIKTIFLFKYDKKTVPKTKSLRLSL